MEKSEFLEIERKYLERRARLQGINPGDLVWQGIPRGFMDIDYHTAVVKSVNVDKNYVEVIDVTRDNKEFKYTSFITESEFIKIPGFTRETIEEEREKYSGIIKMVMGSK